MLIGLLIGAVFAAGPVLWMLSSSFKSNTQIFELPPRLITDTFSFDAYISIFTNPETVRFFINSYVVAGAVTILTLLVAIQRRTPSVDSSSAASASSTSSSSASRRSRRSRC